MSNKSSFSATNYAAKNNDAINREMESRLNALKSQIAKGSKGVSNTQKMLKQKQKKINHI